MRDHPELHQAPITMMWDAEASPRPLFHLPGRALDSKGKAEAWCGVREVDGYPLAKMWFERAHKNGWLCKTCLHNMSRGGGLKIEVTGSY